MYDVIRDLIDHYWASTGSTGDQQYIYFISGAVIIIFFAVLVDLIYRIFHAIFKKGDF